MSERGCEDDSVRRSLAIPVLSTLSVGADKAVFSIDERTGNIWMAEFKP